MSFFASNPWFTAFGAVAALATVAWNAAVLAAVASRKNKFEKDAIFVVRITT
jgi:hypothetical protein